MKKSEKVTIPGMIVKARVPEKTYPRAIDDAAAKCVSFPKSSGIFVEMLGNITQVIRSAIHSFSAAEKVKKIFVRRRDN